MHSPRSLTPDNLMYYSQILLTVYAHEISFAIAHDHCSANLEPSKCSSPSPTRGDGVSVRVHVCVGVREAKEKDSHSYD